MDWDRQKPSVFWLLFGLIEGLGDASPENLRNGTNKWPNSLIQKFMVNMNEI